jgi:hypothetical protein
MTFDDHARNERLLPSKEAILKALAAVGQRADGSPLDLDGMRRSSVEYLLGFLDALTSDLAERASHGPRMPGNALRRKVVSGRRMYVESDRYNRTLEDFFISRVQSLGEDMRTWSSQRLMG